MYKLFNSPRSVTCGPSRASRASLPGLLALIALAAVLAACGKKDEAAQGAGGPGGGTPPPPQVGVITVKPTTVPLVADLPGRLESWRSAQVRARAVGIVQKRLFEEGTEVRVGQPLYRLDDDTARAAQASATAQVARAEASLAQANAQLERNRPLAEARAISAQDWLATQTAAKAAAADLAATRAALASAKVNVGYALITAPVSGRIGRSNVSEGALVSPSDQTPLALIQQSNPLYVNFSQSASEVMRLRRLLADGKLKRAGSSAAAEVKVVLDDGTVYPQPGKLLFTDLTVDSTTGQISLRAEVPNAQGVLLPGLYVQVRLTQAISESAILVPQQAVTRGTGSDTVLVVGEGNKPAPRQIRIAGAQGSQWIVLDGLKEGERVVVDGFQKMFVPGAPVTPVPWTPGAAPAGPGGQPGAAGAAGGPAAGASAAPAATASGASR